MLNRRRMLGTGLASAALAASPAVRAADAAPETPSPRRTFVLADGWRFHPGHAADPAQDFNFGAWQRTYAKPGYEYAEVAWAKFDDSGWAAVRVPHDWANALPYAPPAHVPKDTEDYAAAHGFHAIGRDFPQNSVGWYRLTLPAIHAARDAAVWLEFDGVFRNSTVIVNGYSAGGSASGYAPFRVDIANFLNVDGTPDQLVVRVDASLGEGWFYEGAGIYRHVRLVVAAPVHIPQWGVFVRSVPRGGGAAIAITTEIATHVDAPATVTLKHRIVSPDGRTVAERTGPAATIPARDQITQEQAFTLPTARLWSVQDPALYTLVTELLADGVVIDRVETRFGIRSVRFDPARGFFLNDAPVKLLGVCNHQDHAGVGSAIPDALHDWRVATMQDMGANAWRSAHNPPSQALLDVCDRRGMLMMAETRANTTSPDALDQLDRMIRSSRNHPCVFAWSVGNEEGHQASPRGRRLSTELVARVRRLDPTRPTCQAMDQGWYDDGAARAVDVVGFNYRTDQIAAFHAKYPQVPVLGTETASTVATRGAYANETAQHVLRAYDTEHPWWASTAEEWWKLAMTSDYIAGGFIWTGFDYRGEPTPFPAWPSVSSYFGVADLCGFPKDNYYYYRAWWRTDLPQVHLLPHWTWPGHEGQPIEVWAHGNVARVELLLNGRSLGAKPMPRGGHLAWQVVYAPGVIEARGFDAGGRMVVSDRRTTAGAPARLILSTGRTRLAADAADLAVIAVQVVDAHGTPVPDADCGLHVALSGPARLLGTGNGNPNDHTPDHAPDRPAFHGLAQALVQTTGAAGAIAVTVTSPGLPPAMLNLFAHA